LHCSHSHSDINNCFLHHWSGYRLMPLSATRGELDQCCYLELGASHLHVNLCFDELTVAAASCISLPFILFISATVSEWVWSEVKWSELLFQWFSGFSCDFSLSDHNVFGQWDMWY
jgi:hypothetical protein